MLTMQVMACMGIIIGIFLLLGISLTDFTGNIFKRLLDGPKGIREEILEQTQRKKKSFLRREVEEIQSILKATDRENTFPFLCRYHWFYLLSVPPGQPCLEISFWYPLQR